MEPQPHCRVRSRHTPRRSPPGSLQGGSGMPIWVRGQSLSSSKRSPIRLEAISLLQYAFIDVTSAMSLLNIPTLLLQALDLLFDRGAVVIVDFDSPVGLLSPLPTMDAPSSMKMGHVVHFMGEGLPLEMIYGSPPSACQIS